ncbi:MAG: hypothetical protein ACJAUR_000571 [Ulvibacter sp.]|jgi:hypothetical protein
MVLYQIIKDSFEISIIVLALKDYLDLEDLQ